jgi:pilus assembly protein Flp/PilA
MRALVQLIRSAILDNRAATAIEYGLIVALIVIAMIASLQGVAGVTIGMWGNVSNKVAAASQ